MSDAVPGRGRVEDLPLALLADLFSELVDLDHDLGKYIGLQTRFCGLDAPDEELRDALRADLLATRRQGDTELTAWALWDARRPASLDDDPRVRQLDSLLADLSRTRLDGDRASLLAVAARAAEVRQACRALVDLARQRLDAAGMLEDAW